MRILPGSAFSISVLLPAVASRSWNPLRIPKSGLHFIVGSSNEPLVRRAEVPRGGGNHTGDAHNGAVDTTTATLEKEFSDNKRELTLDEKVHAAMKKLGLDPPLPEMSVEENDETTTAISRGIATEITTLESSIPNNTSLSLDAVSQEKCGDGVCEIPKETGDSDALGKADNDEKQNDPNVLAESLSQKLKVDLNMAWAALGATSVATENNKRLYNEKAAFDMIQMELDMISQIQEDSEDVKLLIAEGYDSFFVRRALAFAERNVDDARAILLADKMDEEEEAAAEAAKVEEANRAYRRDEKKQVESSFKTVNVDAGFDPTKIGAKEPEPSLPNAASRESVIFEASASQIQELVLESPVPVLLDIYADWCGPCKALSPILEDMAVKSGGTLRLVKVNSDNERAVSQALEVTALPTIFGFRDGKILHMFQGMPKSEEMMKNFLMGLLIPGHSFNPPVSESQQQKYKELSTKLMKVASTASFSFSARERLHDRITSQIENLVQQTGNVFDTEQSVVTIRSLLSNIIRDPFDVKFRTVNLSNKVIATKISKYPACIAILKCIGFATSGSTMIIGKGRAFVNVAPLTVTRDAIDKWIDRTRYEVAREARKRRDEEDRVRIQAKLAATKALEEENEVTTENAAEAVDLDACLVKLRIDGKKKVHEVSLHADDPLSALLQRLPNESSTSMGRDGYRGEIILTCVAKRLVAKSSDDKAMSKSLRQYGLVPTATIVVKLPAMLTTSDDDGTPKAISAKLTARAASKKKLKKGTHTMQSIGIYSSEDNAKGELIDGGGGTWYEHDMDDDEEETKSELDSKTKAPNDNDSTQNDENVDNSKSDDEEEAEER